MARKPIYIVSLTGPQALAVFMRADQFVGFELPEYFDFTGVLSYVRKTIGTKAYEDCLSGVPSDSLPDVNLDILLNKDGRYGVRPLVLANPFLYYFLAREMCTGGAWKAIRQCFKAYSVPHVRACSMPLVPRKPEAFYRSGTILNWWSEMEQRSIELSLEYRYMFVTDITNCYGAIELQSIERALLCQGTRFANDANRPLAAGIIRYLHALQHGRNVGIPQGGTLFDFVGEIVLGYADLLLHEALERKGVKDYKVLRYRDDYRVFSNDRDQLEQISYTLQGVLESLNFRMNTQKTKVSDSVIIDSIKADKLAYIYNTPIFNKKGTDFDSFEKHLLFILMFGRQFPNAGQLKTLLSDLDRRIAEWVKPEEVEVVTTIGEGADKLEIKTTEIRQHRLPGGSVRAMVSVATQIALDNVSASHYALRVISRMIDTLYNEREKDEISLRVAYRLCRQYNSEYSQLWLQNMTYLRDKAKKRNIYTLRLCRLVMGDMHEPLWNNAWLKPELADGLPYGSVVSAKALKKITPVITFRETRLYDEQAAAVAEGADPVPRRARAARTRKPKPSAPSAKPSPAEQPQPSQDGTS